MTTIKETLLKLVKLLRKFLSQFKLTFKWLWLKLRVVLCSGTGRRATHVNNSTVDLPINSSLSQNILTSECPGLPESSQLSLHNDVNADQSTAASRKPIPRIHVEFPPEVAEITALQDTSVGGRQHQPTLVQSPIPMEERNLGIQEGLDLDIGTTIPSELKRYERGIVV